VTLSPTMARDFDLKTLEKELATAVQVEEKRVLVDEVKKKAVHSTGSYEEFRQVRVSVAQCLSPPYPRRCCVAERPCSPCAITHLCLAYLVLCGTEGVGG